MPTVVPHLALRLSQHDRLCHDPTSLTLRLDVLLTTCPFSSRTRTLCPLEMVYRPATILDLSPSPDHWVYQSRLPSILDDPLSRAAFVLRTARSEPRASNLALHGIHSVKSMSGNKRIEPSDRYLNLKLLLHQLSDSLSHNLNLLNLIRLLDSLFDARMVNGRLSILSAEPV